MGLKKAKAFSENIPHTVTPPPPAWAADTRQVCSMDSCCWSQIPDSICVTQQKFSFIRPGCVPTSLAVQCWWLWTLCSSSFLFLVDRTVIFCCCSWSASRFSVVFCNSEMLFCCTTLVQSGYPSHCQLQPAWMSPSDLLRWQGVSVCRSAESLLPNKL